jgi:hypothetical protein
MYYYVSGKLFKWILYFKILEIERHQIFPSL